MPLEEYRKKRKFDKTPEPPGRMRRSKAKAPVFVVQKHDATSLHYDFRLEIGGTLASWAIPKGPSMNPADKRLAIRTEDHPLEYAGFEGVIPEGHYGAGSVMVWDRGTFEVQDAPEADAHLARGEIEFTLHGQKLRGGFVLIRSGARSLGASSAGRWLLIKRRDEYAESEWDVESPALGRSSFSGRTLEEIAAGKPGTRTVGRTRTAS